MWSDSYPINLITTKGSWYEPYANALTNSISKLGINCKLLYKHEDIDDNSVAIYLSYQKIVPLEYITRTHRSIVVHASNLPQGKGFSPWVWQIIEGLNRIPLSLFEMEETIDSGKIFFNDYLVLEGTELLDEVRELLAYKIAELVTLFLSTDNEPIGHPQSGQDSYYRKRSPQDSKLDIHKTIQEQFNLLRVVDNDKYPAFFDYLGKRYLLKIYEDTETSR